MYRKGSLTDDPSPLVLPSRSTREITMRCHSCSLSLTSALLRRDFEAAKTIVVRDAVFAGGVTMRTHGYCEEHLPKEWESNKESRRL